MFEIPKIVFEIALFYKGGIIIEFTKSNSLIVSETFFKRLEKN